MNKQDLQILNNLRLFLTRANIKWAEKGASNEVDEFLLRLEHGNVNVPKQGTVAFPNVQQQVVLGPDKGDEPDDTASKAKGKKPGKA